MGSAFLCAMTGIDMPVIENQAAYVAGWLRHIGTARRSMSSGPQGMRSGRPTSSPEAGRSEFSFFMYRPGLLALALTLRVSASHETSSCSMAEPVRLPASFATLALFSPVELVCITPAGTSTFRLGPCRRCVVSPLRITGRWPGMLREGAAVYFLIV